MKKKLLKYYPSKLLLFGEYAVIDGSTALAMPFEKFKSKWSFNHKRINKEFTPFIEYLRNIDWNKYSEIFQFDKLKNDIDSGLYFESNIPVGYGAGSSGSLTAAIYDNYFEKNDDDIKKIRDTLSLIEGYFHGISSGIDPLVSFLNKSIKIINKDDFEIIKDANFKLESFNLYLLDSNIKRETKKYVNIYNKEIKTENFISENLNLLISLNNKIISSFLIKDENMTFSLWKEISLLQYHFFKKMIIPSLTNLWKQSIQSDDFSIKLCGAGGGGFYLIIAKNGFNIKSFFNDFKLIKI